MMGIGKLSSDQVSIGHGDDYMERNELSQNHQENILKLLKETDELSCSGEENEIRNFP